MTTLPIGRYRFFQKLQPLALLTKITSQPTTGCLQVFSASASWSFYLENTKLIYACQTNRTFDLLYKTLLRLSKQIPTLHNGVYQQLQAIFETGIENQAISNPDYLAICWLVSQKYISLAQAGILIEQLALEVLQSFLNLKEGSYEFTSESLLDDLPKFCHLDLHLLVEHCQKRSRNPGNAQSPDQQKRHSFSQQQRQPHSKPHQAFSQQKEHQTADYPQSFNTTHINRRQTYPQIVNRKLYKIFCIDDSPIVLTTIRSFLDEQIFCVRGVNDPLNALMQVLRVKPDMILLDIEMPKLNGYELCSLLRKHSYFENIPVIMLTGRTGLIDRVRAKIVKSSGYLTKPFTQVDLLKVVFQHLE
ncbi:MAG: response regulator [Rhizonema sp. NSF051]|nr:response regulator [Rhizonema sp. NSF051]